MMSTSTNVQNLNATAVRSKEVVIGPFRLPADLYVPADASALVVFAHGRGSSRLSPRNRQVARALNERGMATLLFDLLRPDKEQDRRHVFDISFLAERLTTAVAWIDRQPELAQLALGLFGASTGTGAALMAAAQLGDRVHAIVSRGGRPDLANAFLDQVTAPTLLIVGGLDDIVVELNERAYAQLPTQKALKIVPGASHLFLEPGAFEIVIELAGDWFATHLIAHESRGSG